MVEPAVGQAIANHLIDHGRKVATLLGRHTIALLAKLDLGLQQLDGLVHVAGQCGAVHGKDVDIAGVERTFDDGIAAKGPKLRLAAKAVVLDHLLDQALRGSTLAHANDPAVQVLNRGKARTLLDHESHVVGAVRRREIPALLALVGDGVGRRDHVKLAVIDQRAARLGRYIGKLDKLLGTGILVAHAKDGSGYLVAQIDFHALKAALGGVVIAIAGNVLLNTGIQMATRLDGRKLGPLVGALAAGGVAATGKRGPRQRKHAGASQLQKVTARHGRPRPIRHVHHRA